MKTNQFWLCFIVGKEAFSRGFHDTAFQVFSVLKHKVDAEFLYFWLEGLACVSDGERRLSLHSIPQTTSLLNSGLVSILVLPVTATTNHC
jgi:hypothetical protein